MKNYIYLIALFLFPVFVYSQNVGIGTTAPLMKLHVSDTLDPVLLLENTKELLTDAKTSLYFKTGIGTFSYTGGIKTIGTGFEGSIPTARLGLFTFTNSTPEGLIERVSILDNGNTGIGIIDPTERLHVNGNVKVAGTISGLSDPVDDQDAATKAYVDAAAGGGGALGVYDGNGVKLGTLTALSTNGITVSMLTSTGHLVKIFFDGTMPNGQIYYSGASCTGDALLNAGGSGAAPIYAKTVVYSHSKNSLMVATGADASGAVPATTMIAQSIDNPECGPSSGTKDGWQIIEITPAAAGLPSFPFVTPIEIHN